MSEKYLPHWASEYSDFKSQYEACSIMIKQSDVYTLLPVRLDEDVCPYLSARWCFSLTVNRIYGGGGIWRHKSYIQNAKYAFAKKLYLESVVQLITEYPDIEEISFGRRRNNGIYPINWRYAPALLGKRLYEIMERKLDEGFYIDEFVRIEFEESGSSHSYKFYGVLDMEKNELEHLLYSHSADYIKEIHLHRGIRYTLDECKKYFREFSDDILMLGNQPRAYAKFYCENAELFEAAINGDFDRMVQLAENGGDLNAMDEEGNTPFAYFAFGMIRPYDGEETFPEFRADMLDKLIMLGANPAFYGIGTSARGPLAEASKYGNLTAVKYLLSKGVDPLYYPVKDEEDMSEFTAAEEAEAEYLSETGYRGVHVAAKYNNYLEISKLLTRR